MNYLKYVLLTSFLALNLLFSTFVYSNGNLQFQSVYAQISENASSPAGNHTTQFSNLSSSSLGIAYSYPTNWVNITQYFGTSLANIQYIESGNQSKFRTILGISVENLTTPTTIDQYVKSTDRILTATANSYNVTGTDSMIFLGKPSFLKTFTMKNGLINKDLSVTTVNIKGMQLYSIEGNNAYTISLLSEESQFQNFLSIFQKMSDSFKITNPSLSIMPTSELSITKGSIGMHSVKYNTDSYSLNRLSQNNFDQIDFIKTIDFTWTDVGNIGGAVSVTTAAALLLIFPPAQLAGGLLLTYYGLTSIGWLTGMCWALCGYISNVVSSCGTGMHILDYALCEIERAGPILRPYV